ncbi:class I SAM-dependent methyltransferase [Labilibaculum sp.]|uniref:class I SAM-dependent methyltransferase n=1 Tax=Labilibaculum sp. TaxID=2060723 RepID=UPI002AA802A2|nr:class I SAM-dependent methyltransferase [Labilibaculum sp.]MBN2596445.1 class I SAM-dependent methyltransferase [Marinifilaceae bacterium]
MRYQCPLCNNNAKLFYKTENRIHYQCNTCFGIFADANSRPGQDVEKTHYQQHNNDIEDTGYQKFVSPITNSVRRDFTANHKGLDFGAGTGPVISKVLTDHGFSIVPYDPYFHNYPKLLQEKYDYIASCEVIEHFYNPHKEFSFLKKILKPKGKLYCMTHLYNENIDFANWYYKNDPTHVFIYQKQTFEWIQKEFAFADVMIENRLVVFST